MLSKSLSDSNKTQRAADFSPRGAAPAEAGGSSRGVLLGALGTYIKTGWHGHPARVRTGGTPVPPRVLSGALKRPFTRGFTLIELLVVVAIIALLISILLPALKRAKRQALQLECATHMRSLRSAAMLYGADNKDYIPRGIQWVPGDLSDEYAVFASVVLQYLGWDGKEKLWGGSQRVRRRLNNAVRETPQFQCPDYPVYEDQDPFLQPGDNPQHYITSTFPMPYPQQAVDEDAPYLEWEEDAEWVAEAADETYVGTSRIEDFPVEAQPARLIYISEVDKSVPWTYQRYGLRFYSMFRTSQLPFGGRPRIGEDQRHPGGLNAMFFDGHVETLDHHKMDPGFPTPLDQRLRYFTIMEEGWTP